MKQEATAGRLEEFLARRDKVRREMGGLARLEKLRADGRQNGRQRIEALVDPGSFVEIGTLTASEYPEQRAQTPGDGKIAGNATVAGRAVAVLADDITVKRATSATVGSRKLRRVYDDALRFGRPIIYLGETAGARLPDALGSEGFSKVAPPVYLGRRCRRVPLATAIVGESFGGSSIVAGMSDFVVQVRGSCLALTAPRVIEVATGEKISMEELGGTSVHESLTGQIDLAVESDAEAYQAMRRFLSYLPQNAWSSPERTEAPEIASDPALRDLIPASQRRSYDALKLIGRIVDPGSLMELRPRFGRGLITALARIDGYAIGLIASQPKDYAGALTPDSCDKAARLVCLCDSFDLPIVFLQDTPGFLVGKQVEHDRLVAKTTLFLQTLALASVPKVSVVVRKAFGLAYFNLGGHPTEIDLLCCWPNAEIGFMDPRVGANVLYGGALEELSPTARDARLSELADGMASATDPYPIAEVMHLDEIIDPADTRPVLAEFLNRSKDRPLRSFDERLLATWPASW